MMKDSELKALLREVEAEMKAALANDKGLRKNDGDLGEDEGAPAEASAAPAAEGSAPAGPPADDGMGPGDAPPPGDDIAADDGGGGDLDPEALKAEYAQLPPEELKIHYMAAKAALFELMGGADGAAAGPEASAAPAGPGPEASAPPPAPAAGPDEEAFKAEMKKSEEKYKALETKLELMTKAMELMAGAPMRKAVTGIPALNKSEKKVPTRAEQEAKVQARLAKGNLSKAEHNRLVSWSWNKDAAYDLIKDIVE